jgi:hypothetical protein
MNRKSSITIAGYLLLVFFAGVGIGALGDRLYLARPVNATASPEAYRQKMVAELQRRLQLRSDQVSQLNAILDGTRTRFHEIHKRIEPDLDALRNQQNSDIRAMLNDTQRAEFDKWHAEREKQRTQAPRPQ